MDPLLQGGGVLLKCVSRNVSNIPGNSIQSLAPKPQTLNLSDLRQLHTFKKVWGSPNITGPPLGNVYNQFRLWKSLWGLCYGPCFNLCESTGSVCSHAVFSNSLQCLMFRPLEIAHVFLPDSRTQDRETVVFSPAGQAQVLGGLKS